MVGTHRQDVGGLAGTPLEGGPALATRAVATAARPGDQFFMAALVAGEYRLTQRFRYVARMGTSESLRLVVTNGVWGVGSRVAV